MCGGFTQARDADEEVKAMANELKAQTEGKLGATFSEFEAVSFKTQVVAGTNYKIKVQVGNRKYVHIKVFVPLPGKKAKNQLLEQEGGKTLEDPL